MCYAMVTIQAQLLFTASGGTSPYTYLWSNSSTASTISNLSSNLYYVTVTDNNACKAYANVTITQPTALTASITSQTNELCYGNSIGQLLSMLQEEHHHLLTTGAMVS